MIKVASRFTTAVEGHYLIYLRSIDLNGCFSIKDNVLADIGNVSNLMFLSLDMRIMGNSYITDDGLKHLKKLNKLKGLNLNECKIITGPGVLTHLGEMNNLEFLSLVKCEKISLARLQELKQILPNTHILP
jgi:hypothetical protein